MLRNQTNHTTVADWELGMAAVLLILGVALTALILPGLM